MVVKRRIEVIVTIQKKKRVGVGGPGPVGGRVDVKKKKKTVAGGGGPVGPGGSGRGVGSVWM